MKKLIGKVIKKIGEFINNPLSRLDPCDKALIYKIRKNNLTYLSDSKLASIVNVCSHIKKNNISGIMVEAGCALGGSTILISKTKNKQSPLFVYDVFEMIPAPTEEDGEDIQRRYKTIREGSSNGIGGNKYYGYEDNLYNKVQQNLQGFEIYEEQDQVYLIKGLLQDTMDIQEPVAFAHIDVDWYQPVKICLERIVPKLVVGGSVILDDYNDWSGCKKATDEYFMGMSHKFSMDDSAGSIKVTRIQGD